MSITFAMAAKVEVDLNAVALLLHVVRRGSFSAAGRELGLPVSSVSRRVAALEASLGVSLLARTTRSLHLTEAGRGYVERASRAVEELGAIHEDLRRQQAEPRGFVRLTAPAALGEEMSVIAAALLARHPHIALEVDLSDRNHDLREGRFDVALRAGKPGASELIARRLLHTAHFLFASPSYVRRAPRLRELADLREHRLLAHTASDGVATWQLWHARRALRHRFEPVLAINEMTALRRAAAEGAGIALLPGGACSQLLAQGDLVRVLGDVRGPEGGIWLHFARRSKLSAATAAVVDHCLATLPALLRASGHSA